MLAATSRRRSAVWSGVRGTNFEPPADRPMKPRESPKRLPPSLVKPTNFPDASDKAYIPRTSVGVTNVLDAFSPISCRERLRLAKRFCAALRPSAKACVEMSSAVAIVRIFFIFSPGWYFWRCG